MYLWHILYLLYLLFYFFIQFYLPCLSSIIFSTRINGLSIIKVPASAERKTSICAACTFVCGCHPLSQLALSMSVSSCWIQATCRTESQVDSWSGHEHLTIILLFSRTEHYYVIMWTWSKPVWKAFSHLGMYLLAVETDKTWKTQQRW